MTAILYYIRHFYWATIAFALPLAQVWAETTGSTPEPSGTVGRTPEPSGTQAVGSFDNPLRFDTLDQFLTALLKVIIQIGTPVVVLAIIWTGFLFVKAQGNPDELKTARKAFFWTLIGALLVLGAVALSALVQGTVSEIIG